MCSVAFGSTHASLCEHRTTRLCLLSSISDQHTALPPWRTRRSLPTSLKRASLSQIKPSAAMRMLPTWRSIKVLIVRETKEGLIGRGVVDLNKCFCCAEIKPSYEETVVGRATTMCMMKEATETSNVRLQLRFRSEQRGKTVETK